MGLHFSLTSIAGAMLALAGVSIAGTLGRIGAATGVLLAHATQGIKNQALRAFTQDAVDAVEQRFAGGLSNATKRERVEAQIRQHFPWAGETLIETALEAAVYALPHATPWIPPSAAAAATLTPVPPAPAAGTTAS